MNNDIFVIDKNVKYMTTNEVYEEIKNASFSRIKIAEFTPQHKIVLEDIYKIYDNNMFTYINMKNPFDGTDLKIPCFIPETILELENIEETTENIEAIVTLIDDLMCMSFVLNSPNTCLSYGDLLRMNKCIMTTTDGETYYQYELWKIPVRLDEIEKYGAINPSPEEEERIRNRNKVTNIKKPDITGNILYKYVYNDEIVYIGITKNLTERYKQHLPENELFEKADVFYYLCANSTEKHLLEQAFINQYKPVLNTQYKYKGFSELIHIDEDNMNWIKFEN